MNQLLSAELDLDVLLREIATAAVKITGAVVATLWMVDEDAKSLRLVVFSDEAIGAGQAFRRAAFGEGAVGWVAQHRAVLHIDDIFEDGRTAGLDWWREHGLTSCLHRARCWMAIAGGGALDQRPRPDRRSATRPRELLDGLVAQTAAALRNAALYREVSATNRRLEQEVRRNELLLNSVADGVFGVDGEGRVTFLNPAALRLLGYSAGELLDAGCPRAAPSRRSRGDETAERLGRARATMELALRHGRAYRSSRTSLWHRDGRALPVELVVTPLEEDGTTLGAVVTFRDIRREKEAERQRQALAQSEKLRALGQLAGGVAHDLNQSLGLVVGHSELALGAMQAVPELPPDLRESLETIMQGALDGAETVKRLQTFVRGQPEGDAERISMGSADDGRGPLDGAALARRGPDGRRRRSASV